MKVSIKKPVLIFLGGIFLLSAVIIIARGIKLPQIPFLNSTKTPQKVSVQPKMADIKVQGDKIVLKYSELDLFMAECCSSVVKDTKSKKDGDSVKITGKATFPFSANFEGNLTPYIENEKIKVRLSNLILGKVESPEMLADKLGNLINLGFDNKINSKYKVKDVKIKGEGIEITIN